MEGINDGLGKLRHAHYFVSSSGVRVAVCACGARQNLASLVVDTLPRRNLRIKITTPVARFEDPSRSPSNLVPRPLMTE